jgi:hypothetical protein
MAFNGSGLEVSVLPPGSEPSASNRIVQFTTAKFEMPSYFAIAGRVDVSRSTTNALLVLGSFQSNNFSGDNLNAGAEWSHRDLIILRGSWFGTYNTNTDPTTGSTSSSFGSGDDLYQGWALGAEVAAHAGSTKMGVTFGWRPVRTPFDDIYEIGARFNF